MPPEMRLLDGAADGNIVRRIDTLNKRFELGLAVHNWPTKLDMPEYADSDTWSRINRRITELHRSDRQRLNCALDVYEEWASKAVKERNWVEKSGAVERLLGEPTSHVKHLEMVLGISPYSTKPGVGDRRQSDDDPPPLRRTSSVSRPAASKVEYPELSMNKAGNDRFSGRTSSVNFQTHHSPDHSPTSPHNDVPESLQKEGLKNQRKRPSTGKDSDSSSRPSKSARVLQVNPKDMLTANCMQPKLVQTSFETNISGVSTRTSFVDTPATSFGLSQPTKIIQNASTIDQGLATPNNYSTASGFSQFGSTLENAMLQEEGELAARRPGTISSAAMQSMGPRVETPASTYSTLGSGPTSQLQDESNTATSEPSSNVQNLFHDAHSPFRGADVSCSKHQFRSVYETVRLALDSECDASEILSKLNVEDCETYDKLWASLSTSLPKQRFSQRSTRAAWDAADKNAPELILSGRLDLRSEPRKKLNLDIRLSPLKIGPKSHRFARKYGAHRFFILDVPKIPEWAEAYFATWLVRSKHHFLGRQWRSFYLKDNKGGLKDDKKRFKSVYMFAVAGTDIDSVSRYSVIDWHLCFNENVFRKHKKKKRKNIEKPPPAALKYFSRIALGLTDSYPTVVFDHDQIKYVDDVMSCCWGSSSCLKGDHFLHSRYKHTGEVMNDGSALISFAAAQKIAKCMKLTLVPSAFQGRLGGAKGVWIVDYSRLNFGPASCPEMWIQISKSQLKYEIGSSRMEKDSIYRQFDLHSFPQTLGEYKLNHTLIPILQDRGVPENTFSELLRTDVDRQIIELELAMHEGGIFLRKWIQDNYATASERILPEDAKFSGAFPNALVERIIILVDAGLTPKTDHVLYSYCREALELYRQRLEKNQIINLPRSTYALMIPDPLGVLEEGEIHIHFSRPFFEPVSGDPYRYFDGVDVLVARFPAYLPSDIQKVRAVFKPELGQYEDVVIFPIKSGGKASLATLLSGGDFDGDKAFICWEPCLVNPFSNAIPPVDPLPETFGMKQDKTSAGDLVRLKDIDAFLETGFHFNIKQSMLGTCSNWYQRFNYHRHNIQSQLQVGTMLGLLVDAPKQGYIFGRAEWSSYLKSLKLSEHLKPPFYRDKDNSSPTGHVLDVLHIEIARHCKVMTTQAFEKERPPPFDRTLTEIHEAEKERLKADGESLNFFRQLHSDIDSLHEWFLKEKQRLKVQEQRIVKKTNRPIPREDQNQNFASFLADLRQKFLDIAPGPSTHPMRERWWQDWKSNSPRLSTAGSWTMLKASAVYARKHRETLENKFPWLVAGLELCKIKAQALGSPTFLVQSKIHAGLRTDPRYARRLQERLFIPQITEDNEYHGMEEDILEDEDWLSGVETVGSIPDSVSYK